MKSRRHSKRVVIKCRSCGWKWRPDPVKWRNNLNPERAKVLACPNCHVLNKIDAETVRKILSLNR